MSRAQQATRSRASAGLALVLALSAGALTGTGCAGPGQPAPNPPVEPYESGYLRVSELHELYWETVGDPAGIPVIVLHDGPGGSASPELRRFFDPRRFHVLLFDQRGALRSRPRGEWRENTTADLLDDIEQLRESVGFPGKAILFGGGWGSTLALAYAERHPERVAGLVLRGVSFCTGEEIDFLYHGGASMFFPEAWERLKLVVPYPDDPSYPRQLFEMITGDDPRERETAIEGWSYFETRISSVYLTDEETERVLGERGEELAPRALLESHYRMNGCFLREGQLLEEAGRIASIPTFIVQGRYDLVTPPLRAFLLAKRLASVRLELVDAAGHSAEDPANVEALRRGVEWVAEQAGPAAAPAPAPPEM